jgi:hypothetical protein
MQTESIRKTALAGGPEPFIEWLWIRGEKMLLKSVFIIMDCGILYTRNEQRKRRQRS